jgi:fructokinase
VEGLAYGSALVARLRGRPVKDVAPDDPVWDPIVHTLGVLCHALVCATGPFRIAIGGGVITGQSHLLGRINSALIDSLGGYMSLPDGEFVVAPRLGDLAGPLGSIALAATASMTETR